MVEWRMETSICTDMPVSFHNHWMDGFGGITTNRIAMLNGNLKFLRFITVLPDIKNYLKLIVSPSIRQ